MSELRYGFGHRIGYALCNAGVSLAAAPVNIVLLYYLTQILGIRPSLAGLALAIPKIWDALIDPMFGGWIDRLTVRLGRRTPVVLLAGAGYLAALVCLFSLQKTSSSTEILGLAIGLSIFSSIAQTALGVTQYALAADMSRDAVGLSGLLSLASMLGQVLSVAGAIVVPLLVVWSGDGEIGYARMAAEIAAVAALLLVAFAFMTRGVPVRRVTSAQETLPLWASLRATTVNREFYLLLVFVICQNVSIVVLLGFLPFANQYVLAGSAHTLSILEGVVGGTVLCGMALAPRFVRRLGALGSMRACNLLAAMALVTLFAASFAPLWVSGLAAGALGVAWGIIAILIQTAMLETARHKPSIGPLVAIGFYLGIMMAGIKLGTSLGGVLSGVFLDVIGFVAGAQAQPAGTLGWLRAGYTLLPLAFILVSAFFLRRIKLASERSPPSSLLAASTSDLP